ncbi:hypothetical protein BDQ17DRAFT_1426885 [Cyathus striatus]|nr:hypothetical protein BDQ17DRAFT_1426885 [Cyathus striatus]
MAPLQKSYGWATGSCDASAWLVLVPPHDEEEKLRADHVVRFWLRGIEAAERGETLKWDELYASLDKKIQDEWNHWGYAPKDENGWGQDTKCTSPDVGEGWAVVQKKKRSPHRRNPWNVKIRW